jgi:hypothetical protein
MLENSSRYDFLRRTKLEQRPAASTVDTVAVEGMVGVGAVFQLANRRLTVRSVGRTVGSLERRRGECGKR